MSFRFKQFEVQDDRCGMKVGTDGVLLGCWAPPGTHVLDVGTGSGLIALMIAQRCPQAEVDAIDIDTEAIEQARQNFHSSPWSARLKAYPARLQEWQSEKQYDLIVSNPPYFQNSMKNPDETRLKARHTDSLSYAELLHHSARLLSCTGRLAIILPAEAEEEIIRLAAAEELRLTRVTRVFSKENKPARRILVCFTQSQVSEAVVVTSDSLILENEKGGRSHLYQSLAEDFYL